MSSQRTYHGKFSAGDRVSVLLPGWKRSHEGIVKDRTATGYTVEFKGKVHKRHFKPAELCLEPDGPELRVLISTLLKHSYSVQDFQTEMLSLLTNPRSKTKLMFYNRSPSTGYWNRLEVEIELLRALEKSLERATVASNWQSKKEHRDELMSCHVLYSTLL